MLYSNGFSCPLPQACRLFVLHSPNVRNSKGMSLCAAVCAAQKCQERVRGGREHLAAVLTSWHFEAHLCSSTRTLTSAYLCRSWAGSPWGPRPTSCLLPHTKADTATVSANANAARKSRSPAAARRIYRCACKCVFAASRTESKNGRSRLCNALPKSCAARASAVSMLSSLLYSPCSFAVACEHEASQAQILMGKSSEQRAYRWKMANSRTTGISNPARHHRRGDLFSGGAPE